VQLATFGIGGGIAPIAPPGYAPACAAEGVLNESLNTGHCDINKGRRARFDIINPSKNATCQPAAFNTDVTLQLL